MNKIAVLVDFTRSGKTALLQAKRISEVTGAEIIAVNISESHDDETTLHLIDEYTSSVLGSGINCHAVVGHGNILNAIPEKLSEINPDLVVICTHGIHGVIQKLFGSTVLKMVQALPYPCLVVQENSRIRSGVSHRILFTASPYDSFYPKLKQCSTFAKTIGAEVLHYEMDKYLSGTQELIARHATEASAYFTEQGVPFSSVKEEAKLASLGFAQQTINYAAEHDFDCICVSTNTHQDTMAMGKADKEKLLTNKAGIPVLCCPDMVVEAG